MNNNVVKIAILAFLSLVSFLAYYAEVLIHGWEGLLWVWNFYWTFLLVPLAFCAWIKLCVVKEIKLKALLKFLVSYFITFIAILVLLNVVYNMRFVAYYVFCNTRIMLNAFLAVCVLSGAIMLIFVILFLENIKLQSILNFKLSDKEMVVLVFMPLYIFLAAEVVMVLLFCLRVFPKMQAADLLDSIFIFKTGTVIFSSVMLEGLYILYKKSFISKA